MNEINRETDWQFRALAPAELVRGGKTYRREAALFDDAANRADFDYIGEKKPGAMFHDKVRVRVTYDTAFDTYDIKVVHWDARAGEETVLHSGAGYHSSAFQEVARWAA
jgi:hypothetical protein